MPKPSRSDSDARLYGRALREGWNVPKGKKKEVVATLCAIVAEEKATKREKTAAARALLQASRMELEAIRVAQGALFVSLSGRMEELERGAHGELAKAAGGD
jgi:hypothetical protein